MAEAHPSGEPEQESLSRERSELLQQLEDGLEMPLLVLGFVWLSILIVELIWGLSRNLEILSNVIWGLFLLDFALKLWISPDKLRYLKRNWLAALSLLLPALRLFRAVRVVRILRAARTTRGLRLFRLVSSLNRGMRALGVVMGRRGFGYVLALTLIVTFAGAAGMYAFEAEGPAARQWPTYGAALWWTAMLMTTLGSEHWPQTPEGRLLCLLLALFAFAVFGYMAATLTTFFIGRDAENPDAELASSRSLERLHEELLALREEVRSLRDRIDRQ